MVSRCELYTSPSPCPLLLFHTQNLTRSHHRKQSGASWWMVVGKGRWAQSHTCLLGMPPARWSHSPNSQGGARELHQPCRFSGEENEARGEGTLYVSEPCLAL